jgi:hypothetical protein
MEGRAELMSSDSWTPRELPKIDRGFNEVLEIIVRADEPLAAPAGGA